MQRVHVPACAGATSSAKERKSVEAHTLAVVDGRDYSVLALPPRCRNSLSALLTLERKKDEEFGWKRRLSCVVRGGGRGMRARGRRRISDSAVIAVGSFLFIFVHTHVGAGRKKKGATCAHVQAASTADMQICLQRRLAPSIGSYPPSMALLQHPAAQFSRRRLKYNSTRHRRNENLNRPPSFRTSRDVDVRM